MPRPSKHSSNPLYAWLRDNGYWVVSASSTNKPYSHTLLDGGKLCIPDDAADEFLTRYAQSLATCKQYCVELKTPMFKMFMDVDVKAEYLTLGTISKEQLLNLASFIILDCYREWAKEAPLPHLSDAIVDYRTCIDDELTDPKDYGKFGIHIIWDSWIVNAQEAALFCDFCAEKCTKSFTDIDFCDKSGNMWSKVLDPSVYKGSGLRMTGSRKPGSSFVYLPCMSVSAEGTKSVISNPWARIDMWVRKTTIRYVPPTIQPESASPLTTTPESELSPFMQSRVKLRDQDEEGIIKQAFGNGKSLITVPMSKVQDLLSNILGVMPSYYKKIKFTVVYCTPGNSKIAFIMGSNSRFCANKVDGMHNSNHVYFVLHSEGLYQKCFCQCETSQGRKFGRCQNYSTKVITETFTKPIYNGFIEITKPYRVTTRSSKQDKKAD